MPRQNVAHQPVPANLHDLHRIFVGGAGFLEGLPHPDGTAGTTQAHEPAGVGRTAEADLVPRPRVGVERGQRRPHHHRPCPGDVELIPRPADQPAPGELRHDRFALGLGGAGEAGLVATGGGVVQSGQHQPPGVPVIGHVGVLVAIQAAVSELGVDHLGDRDPGLAVLGQHGVAQRPQRGFLVGGEEPQRPGRFQPGQHHLLSGTVPGPGGVEDVEVGVAPDHLWGGAAPLAGQPRRMRRLLAGPAVG